MPAQAAQPRPTTRIELSALRQRLTALGPAGTAVADGFGFPMVAQAEINQINAGAQVFSNVGCNGCHRPTLTLASNNLIFREPSRVAGFRETTFPAGHGYHAGYEWKPVKLKAGENRLVVECSGAFFVSLSDSSEPPQRALDE